MMRHFCPKIWIFNILFAGILFTAPSLFAQKTKEKLQAAKKKIEQEIQYNTKLLNEVKKTKKTTINQLVIINKQIEAREKLINNLKAQINTVDEQIKLNNEILSELNNDLDNLKKEYAEMIYSAYKHRNTYNKLMFIFSSEDFNQAFKRLKYFQQYSAYRKTQAALITKTQNEINRTLTSLEKVRQEKVALVDSVELEKNRLKYEKKQQNKVYRNLTSKEKELRAAIREKQKAAKKLQEKIEKIISEEIKLAANRTGTTDASGFALTPAELELSNDFSSNKAKLPWPVERGVISETFGTHPHPVLKNIMVKNNGIDILTAKDSKARAIFGGKVTRVISMPNYHYIVMVRHGEYLSVYSNLLDVTVKKGDIVKPKQNIGTVYTDNKTAKTELHFELWKGKTLLNPVNWLAK